MRDLGTNDTDDASDVTADPDTPVDLATDQLDRDTTHDADSGSDLADHDGGDVAQPPTPPARPEVSAARLTELREQLTEILDDESVAGRSLTAYVVELESGQVLYESEADLALAPASNTKLFTTAAALALLGEDYRFHTRVFVERAADGSGVVDGDLYLVGAHDFTFSSDFYESARFPFDQLADELFRQGIRKVNGTVWVYGELVYDGYRLDYYDPADHRTTAVSAFRAALLGAGIDVDAVDNSPQFEPPAGSVPLAEWWSLPLSVGCSRINRISHNEFADVLMRHLGFVYRGQSSYADGAAVVTNWLADQGVDTTGFELYDGSGLSWDNRVSARHVVSLLELMLDSPLGGVWTRTFSVAGVRGTLAERMTGPDTSGRVFAKSGTLSISIATSGVLFNRHDGRRYLFSFIMNDQPSSSAARAVQDDAIEAIAVDLLDAGLRPSMPALAWAMSDGNDRSATIRWDPSTDADGYWVWRSDDGRVFQRHDAEYTEDTVHSLATVAGRERLFVRVTAVNAAGESDPSNVYASRVGDDTSPVLIVDGQERWLAEPVYENTVPSAHDFVVDVATAVDGLSYDSASNAVVASGDVALDDYAAVVWSVGEDSVEHDSFDAAEQALIDAYTAQGGSLFVTGAEIGWDLVHEGSVDDAAFFSDTLRADYLGDDAETFLAEGSGGIFAEFPADLQLMGFFTPDEIVVSFPDQLAPSGGSVEVLRYVGGQGGVAGVQYSGDYHLVLFGFPFESIDNAAGRSAVMAAVVEFFGI